MEKVSAWAEYWPRLKILAWFLKTRLRFSARANRLKNQCNHYHVFLLGLKKEHKHAHQLCFGILVVNFLMEICILHPG